jgi:hypothetical protein
VEQSRVHDAATRKEFVYDSANDADEESDAEETVDEEDPSW